MQLESMSDEYKYFEKALELHQKYNVTKYLSDYNVLPGSSYSPNVIVKALERSLKQNVAINCARDKNFSDKLFYEVIICFDKEFNVIGCENTKGGIFGSCKHGVIDQIDYPDTIHTRCKYFNLNLTTFWPSLQCFLNTTVRAVFWSEFLILVIWILI